MNTKNWLLGALLFCVLGIQAQEQKQDTKIVLITMDGLRWQELFSGADTKLISNEEFVGEVDDLKSKYWRGTAKERREVLMPFIWGDVFKMGQIHGNRVLGSKMNLTNKMAFSYPGYNEILSGVADDKRITSNSKTDNPNVTILEIVNKDKRYKDRVAAFGSWDVFPFIVNENRSGVPVNAGFEKASQKPLSEKEIFLNTLQDQIPSPWGSVRLDAFTHHYALEHMKKTHPYLIYIAYGETDDFAHDGEYDSYLNSANNTDSLIKELWEFTQQDPFYKNNTIFIITTDHGRGTTPIDTWKHHGNDIKESNQVWLITFGKGITSKGEVSIKEQLFTNQIAPTVLNKLGINASKEMKGNPISFD